MKASADQAERLHGFSHDLRNRLIGLQQVLDRLREEADPSERKELLHYGEQQYFKALREVERLMDDMEVARNAVRPEPALIDPRILIRERMELLRFRFDRKGQNLTLDPGVPMSLHTDPNSPQQGQRPRSGCEPRVVPCSWRYRTRVWVFPLRTLLRCSIVSPGWRAGRPPVNRKDAAHWLAHVPGPKPSTARFP